MRISITPQVPPGLLAGIDPARAGRDALPALAENFEVINAKTTNWTVVPWPSPEWACLVHPGVDEETAMARLWEQLIFVLRLDEPDPAAAWHARLAQLHEAGKRVDSYRFDSLRFQGPGTDLTVGLLPTSRYASETPGMQTVDGIVHAPNLPTEEIATTPDPDPRGRRRHGDEAARCRRHRDPRPPGPLRRRSRGRDRGRRRRSAAGTRREGRRRLAARRGGARRSRGPDRQDRRPSSTTRSSTRTRRATSRSATPMRSRSATRIATASTRARSTSTS